MLKKCQIQIIIFALYVLFYAFLRTSFYAGNCFMQLIFKQV